MKVFFKYILGGIVLAVGVMTVSYLQYRFDQSDIRHAVSAVRMARPSGAGQPPLEEMVARRFGVKAEIISWQPRIESKTKGTVQVRAVLPQGPNDLVWSVDLIRFSVQPLTESAKNFAGNGTHL